MGHISDFFRATASDVAELNMDEFSASDFPAVMAKRIEHVKLDQLQEIGGGRPLEVLGDPIAATNDYSAMVFRVANATLIWLEAADNARLLEIAQAWSKIEEWYGPQAINPDHEALVPDLHALLIDIRDLAVAARQSGQRVYLFICP